MRYLPKDYGYDAFYLIDRRSGKTEKYRVYKMDYLFSSMGEEYVIRFFISYRDLGKHRHMNPRSFPEFIHVTTKYQSERKRLIERMLQKGYLEIIESRSERWTWQV